MTGPQVAALTLLLLGGISQVAGTVLTAVELRGIWSGLLRRLWRPPRVEAHPDVAAAVAATSAITGQIEYEPIDTRRDLQDQVVTLDAEFRASLRTTQTTLRALAGEDEGLRAAIAAAKSEAIHEVRSELHAERQKRRPWLLSGVVMIVLGTLLLTAGGIVTVVAPPTAPAPHFRFVPRIIPAPIPSLPFSPFPIH
jgi:hypothetical protein